MYQNYPLALKKEENTECWSLWVAVLHACNHSSLNRELSQGDAASCAMQEATNLDGTAFFGRCALQALSQMSDAAQPNFPSCAYDVTVHTLTKNRTCYNYLCTCNAWMDTLAKEGLWLANPSAASGFQYDPYFWRLPLWINYANCRNLHTTRTI